MAFPKPMDLGPWLQSGTHRNSHLSGETVLRTSRGSMSGYGPSSPGPVVTAAQVPNQPTSMKTRPGSLPTAALSSPSSGVRSCANFCILDHSTRPLPRQISWAPPARTQWGRPVHSDITLRATATPVTCHAPEGRHTARRSGCQENSAWIRKWGEGDHEAPALWLHLDGSAQAADSPRFKSRWGRAGGR